VAVALITPLTVIVSRVYGLLGPSLTGGKYSVLGSGVAHVLDACDIARSFRTGFAIDPSFGICTPHDDASGDQYTGADHADPGFDPGFDPGSRGWQRTTRSGAPDRSAGFVGPISTDRKIRYHLASHTEHSYQPGKRVPLVGHLKGVGIVSTTLQ
jgi:hypothetical protein